MHFSLQMAAADMFATMLYTLLLTAVTQAAVPLTDSTLTTAQLHTVLCVWTVARRHFTPGRPLVVSLPRTTPEDARSVLSAHLAQADGLQTVSVILGKLHEEKRWPIELFRKSGDDTADTSVLHHSYILFVWNGEAGSYNETLENELEILKYSTSWNPRGRFLVVVNYSRHKPAHLLAADICSVLWEVARIVNVVVLIPNQFAYRPLHAMNSTNKTEADRLNLYTWFPFKLGRCGEVQDVILLDEWLFENNGRFSDHVHLYPAKVPQNFMGCPIKLSILGFSPYVIMTRKYPQIDGSTANEVTGLSVEILILVCEKMNLTTVVLAPQQDFNWETVVKHFGEFEDGLSDVLTGTIPLMPVVVTSSFDATIPYLYEKVKMFAPCPKAIPGTEKILTTFSLSVWLTIGLVLLLTATVFWCAGNGPYRSVYNETHTYQSLSYCFQDAWAVLVAVSVPQQPTTSSLRVFFFAYVCFCFAISTVFQAFFVSYLVEPKYEKKIETLDDLLNSDVVFCYNQALLLAKETIAYPEIVKFVDQKTQKEEFHVNSCVERMITKRDMAAISSLIYAAYRARELGNVDVGKIICPLDEGATSGSLIVLLKKGNPLLDRFNVLMRLYLEAGLLERIWAELQHRASLSGGESLREADDDIFFAFAISQLMPAFVVLLVGTVLGSVVFIVELIVNCLGRRKEKAFAH